MREYTFLMILILNFGFYKSACSQQTLTTFGVSDLGGADVNCVGYDYPKIVNNGNKSEWLVAWVQTNACGSLNYKISGRIVHPNGEPGPLKPFTAGYLEGISFNSTNNTYLFLYWKNNLKAQSFNQQLQRKGKINVVDSFKPGLYLPSADVEYDQASRKYISFWLEHLVQNDYTDLNGRLLSGIGRPVSKSSTFLQAQAGGAFSFVELEKESKTGNYIVLTADVSSPGFLHSLAIAGDGSTIVHGPVQLGKDVGLAALSFDGSGTGCVVWQSAKGGIRSRKISSDGAALSGISKVRNGRILFPDIVFDAAHQEYVATWIINDRLIEGARLNPQTCKVKGSIFPVASKSENFAGTVQWQSTSYDVSSAKIAVVWVEYSAPFDPLKEQVRGAIFQK
jgi:hypothetical protein